MSYQTEPSSRPVPIYPISIVIATLAQTSLLPVLTAIRRGSALPLEILICIPEGSVIPTDLNHIPNTHIIICPKRGQVSQRAHGFSCATQPFVLQLDDDILLAPTTLQQLFNTLISQTQPSVIGPVLSSISSHECLHPYPTGFRSLLENIYQTYIHHLPWGLKRQGRVSSASYCWGIDPATTHQPVSQVDWLPGGCVLSPRDYLITYDFYPCSGKAYAEDLLNSHLRTKLGIKHLSLNTSKAFTDNPKRPLNPSSLFTEYRHRRLIARLLGHNQVLFDIAFIIGLSRSYLRNLFQ